jgi:prevent-host-death family protein
MAYAEIGAFDAKARLSELLRDVKEGHSYTITVRGEPIADLIPSKNAVKQDAQAAVDAMLSIKRVKGVSAEMVTEMINEGRK